VWEEGTLLRTAHCLLVRTSRRSERRVPPLSALADVPLAAPVAAPRGLTAAARVTGSTGPSAWCSDVASSSGTSDESWLGGQAGGMRSTLSRRAGASRPN